MVRTGRYVNVWRVSNVVFQRFAYRPVGIKVGLVQENAKASESPGPPAVEVAPESSFGDGGLVSLSRLGQVALIRLERPEAANAQNGALLYALDAAFYEFAQDDGLRVGVLTGRGKHFSSGHDLGPGADRDKSFERLSMWPDHVGKPGVQGRLARESEIYLGLARRWRELPKPTIALVNGACIAGGLILAWCCDLTVAADDAFFADPTVMMGLPGMELFVHPWVMGGRQAKEFLFTGRRVEAAEALRLGMVNHVYEASTALDRTIQLANGIAAMPPMGLSLTKLAVNRCEEAMGLLVGGDSAFGLHQLGHASAQEESGSPTTHASPEQVKRRLAAPLATGASGGDS